MKKCEECSKELRLLEGYNHPTLGKELLLCNHCFDTVSESIAKWKEFVIANSFNNEYSKKSLQLNLENTLPSFSSHEKSLTKF